MPDQPPLVRYSILDPETRAPLETTAPKGPQGTIERAVRILTWAILSVCLALWGVVGFLFWIPLLLRSILQFSLALIQSMLQGARPLEAGRILFETVDFYRRGFLVAIEAVFGRLPNPENSQPPMPAGRFVVEIGWALLVWYAVLLMTGVVETSPGDLWRGVVEYPWGDTLGRLLGPAAEPAAGAPADSVGGL